MNRLIKILTISGIVWLWRFLCNEVCRRRVWIDRILVQGKAKTVFCLALAIFVLPVLFAFLLSLFTELDGVDFVNDRDNNCSPSILWAVLYHFIDPGNQHMSSDGCARFCALVIALLGCVFMNGILISAFVGWYERFVDNWRNGLARYDKLLRKCNLNFVVIIGGNEIIPNIVKQIFQRADKPKFVLLQTTQNVEELRKHLLSFLTAQEEERVIIYSGDRTSKDDIKDLHLECAKEVFILGDSLEDDYRRSHHDAINMNCLQLITEELKDTNREKGNELVCKVLFEYQTTFSIFQFSDISTQIAGKIDFRPFNYYELWAQRVFVNCACFAKSDLTCGYLPLEGKYPITVNSDQFVHFVVVGMSKMGVAMAIEAAHLAHYPNFNENSALKTRITFIDANCREEMGYFQGRFKHLFALSRWRFVKSEGNNDFYHSRDWENADFFEKNTYLGKDFIDVEWEFIEGGIESKEVHNYLKMAARNEQARFTLALCLPQDNQSVAASLYLPDEVYENAIQILVYQRHNSAIIDSISKDYYYKKLKVFGTLSDTYDDDQQNTAWHIAKILDNQYFKMYNEVNAKNIIKNKADQDKTDLDKKDQAKKNQPEKNKGSVRGKSEAAKKWSNIYNANTIWSKLRSICYACRQEISSADIESLARTEHNRWVLEQLLLRFRALTQEEQENVRNGKLDKEKLKGEKMAHVDICSFDKLKEVDEIVCQYDEGFIKIIPSILEECNKHPIEGQ